MQRDPRAFLSDVRDSALAIQGFIAGMDAPLAARIPELPQIVAFRNQLIHGYATVRAITVWNVAQSSLPALLVCVDSPLEKLGEV